jgi:cyclopropane fatty-acyl-phospholipid synthase-like methyltransferase
MIKYHMDKFRIDELSQNNIDRIQIEMIPLNSRVLEIGCATGYMSEYMSTQLGCQVTGVEADFEQAKIAREKCQTLLHGKIDNIDIQNQIDELIRKNGKFDVVFMSQVIEHIAYPEELLSVIHRWIPSKGVLIISTCNVAHWRCRARLLIGKWEYEDYGIFDRTHLRFFSTHSFRKMLEDCGYSIEDEGYSIEEFCPFRILFGVRVIVPAAILRCIPLIGKNLRKKYIHLLRNIISTQFVYKALSAK